MAPGRILSPWQYIRDQFTSLPSLSSFAPQNGLTGKTAIVTGANVGLGLETAKHLAGLGPKRLIVTCRDEHKARNAVEEISQATGCSTVEGWVLDLSSFASVSAFADRYEKDIADPLDLLIANAGLNTFEYVQTADGWESTLQVNHLSTALLTLLLLPHLRRATQEVPFPRVVIVASEVHYLVPSWPEPLAAPKALDKINDIDYCTPTVMQHRYWQSKLLNVFFTRSIASKLGAEPSIVVTCVNPGWCRSALFRSVAKQNWRGVLVKFLAPIFARTGANGSLTILWAALTNESVHGRYTATCRIEEESDFCLSSEGKELQTRIWNETVALLSNVNPQVKTNLELL